MRTRRPIALFAAGALIGALFLGVGVSAATASTPAAGTASFFIASGSGGGGTVVVTGAIGDYGKTTPEMDKNGTTDKKGNYGRFVLQMGSIEANLTTFNAKEQNLGSQSSINATTCSMKASATAPVMLFNGTGLYKGITGTVNLTITFAAVLPRYTSGKNKGQCNESNSANPVAQWGSITGSGNVSF